MRKFITVILTVVMLISCSSVVLAASPDDVSGIWKGLYVGSDDGVFVTRNITLDLDCEVDGHVEGFANIETNGEFTVRYRLAGTMDFDSNRFTFKGTEILEEIRPGYFSFVTFDGEIDLRNFSYTGICDNEKDRSFSLMKEGQTMPVQTNGEEPKGDILFDNFNIARVQNGPTKYTEFELKEDAVVTSITNYHYFNGGTPPGHISLLDESGNIYGPWYTSGRNGQGYVANAYWDAVMDITLEAGVYRIVDSDPTTWSQNSGSDYKGFSVVRGYLLGREITKPEPDPVPLTREEPTKNNSQDTFSEPISVGVKFSWPKKTSTLGWRLYRSKTDGQEGISVTDFYITSNDFIDVNVDSNTTYYYVLREVLAEANPFQGVEEKLGPASAQMEVKTPAVILGGNASDTKGEKQFILMTLDDPIMTVNGENQEIDPGRGTTPVIVNNRTLAPIRAIVEAMGGEVGWNADTQTVFIDYNGRKVEMTIDSKTMSVNGKDESIDVAPRAINSRTMLPVRFVSDALGVSIDWLNSTKQIVVVYVNG